MRRNVSLRDPGHLRGTTGHKHCNDDDRLHARLWITQPVQWQRWCTALEQVLCHLERHIWNSSRLGKSVPAGFGKGGMTTGALQKRGMRRLYALVAQAGNYFQKKLFHQDDADGGDWDWTSNPQNGGQEWSGCRQRVLSLPDRRHSHCHVKLHRMGSKFRCSVHLEAITTLQLSRTWLVISVVLEPMCKRRRTARESLRRTAF